MKGGAQGAEALFGARATSTLDDVLVVYAGVVPGGPVYAGVVPGGLRWSTGQNEKRPYIYMCIYIYIYITYNI